MNLFDFSGYGEYACERIPGRGDTATAMRWYWEAGHFKRELGDVVLKQALARPREASPEPGESAFGVFGIRLEQKSLRENRQRIALERAQCAQAYPELFEEVRALVAAARK